MSQVPSELPAALAALPLDRLEEFERSSGRGFGEMIDEIIKGTWTISTMRELVLARIPAAWRFDRGDGPIRVQASGGEITAITARLYLSTRYSIT